MKPYFRQQRALRVPEQGWGRLRMALKSDFSEYFGVVAGEAQIYPELPVGREQQKH